MNKKIGVLGSGFGLYGYLPSIINNKNNIFTLKKYKKFILGRDDIRNLHDRINYISNEKDIIKKTKIIIYCKRPQDQNNFIIKNIRHLKKKRLYLEKPLSINSKESKKIFAVLKKNKINFSILYTFLYTDWFKKIFLKKKITEIIWNFRSHDIKNKIKNWKLNHKKGGGIIYFYGIHFLPLLILKKYSFIKNSKLFKKNNVFTKWELITKNIDNNQIKISINLNSNDKFQLIRKKTIVYKSNGPFKETNFSDDRIPLIKRYFCSKSRSEADFFLNENVIKLLNIIEKKSKIISK